MPKTFAINFRVTGKPLTAIHLMSLALEVPLNGGGQNHRSTRIFKQDEKPYNGPVSLNGSLAKQFDSSILPSASGFTLQVGVGFRHGSVRYMFHRNEQDRNI